MRHLPEMAKSTHVLEWDEGRQRAVLDELAVEEPLEIRVNGHSAGVTMRTPGDDFDLAAGFLFTEGLVSARSDIVRIGYGMGTDGQTTGNQVDVELTTSNLPDLARFQRAASATSSCGVCGRTSIDSVRARGLAPIESGFAIDARVLTRLPETLRASQRVFGRTGGLHAAALFDRLGAVVVTREDIGRHNAVDKVIGRALLSGECQLDDAVLVVSGRGGFEIVQKAIVARIPVLACVSAPSSLAVQLAREFRLTLVGFLRGQRFIVYSGKERLM